MTAGVATYSFLPWLRSGVATEITRRDGTRTGAPRAEIPITVELDAAGDPREATAALALYGPGEITGIDTRVVIRAAPQPGASDAVPSELPMAEFDEPDFPWRYTPATADARSRVRPWLILAVLADEDITEDTPGGADGRRPAITVTNAAALPRLDQSWAWAHVQVEGYDPASETLQAIVADQPARVRARLLAPRRLDPYRTYTAVLVPAFERGRLAGLGEPVGDDVDGLAEAWAAGDVAVRLPVYYRWSFRTGAGGDFEQLARRLTAFSAGPDVGVRELDVRTPDPALPPASNRPLPVQGALVSPAARPGTWSSPARATFQEELAALLNAPADALATENAPRIVAPPLWGSWLAAQDRLTVLTGDEAQPPPQPLWFHELNGDPRLRVAAGLGAEIVRRQDQQLMAAAWDQVRGIVEANQALRRGQLAREASATLHRRHFAALDTDTFLQVTAPLQAHVAAEPRTTVRHLLASSPIPDGTLDGQFRRIRRSAGPRRAGAGSGALLPRLNSGQLRSRPPSTAPTGMLAPERVLSAGAARRGAVRGELIPTGPLQPPASWRPGVAGGVVHPGSPAPQVPVPVGGDPSADPAAAAAVDRFRLAFADFAAQIEAPVPAGPVLREADLSGVRNALLDELDPRVTIPAALSARLTVASWVSRATDDPLEPIMAAPEFDRPMYEALREAEPQWLLSGAGSLLPDTVSLAESDERFIEAFMVGLNHEMARELLYHGYPTDQRGTYFRQFWDSRGHVTADGDAAGPDTLRDILPVPDWDPAAGLGVNSGRTPPPSADNLVLLIRGELLRRYPNTMVYAVKAILDTGGDRTLGTVERHPIFTGRIEPDITFAGFNLTAGQVRGATGPGHRQAADQGWYFVLSEHPSEPRFGLDADNGAYGGRPAGWRDLNWAHTAASAEDLAALGYLDLDADLPDTTAVVAAAGDPDLAWHARHGRGAKGSNGSDLAWITFQPPFRVAIHGSDMLAGSGDGRR
jgi:hypothetical protein